MERRKTVKESKEKVSHDVRYSQRADYLEALKKLGTFGAKNPLFFEKTIVLLNFLMLRPYFPIFSTNQRKVYHGERFHLQNMKSRKAKHFCFATSYSLRSFCLLGSKTKASIAFALLIRCVDTHFVRSSCSPRKWGGKHSPLSPGHPGLLPALLP